MQHVHCLLHHMAHCVSMPYTCTTWPRDITWTPDALEFFASKDTWSTQFPRRQNTTRESVHSDMYRNMRMLSTIYGGLGYTELHHVAQHAHQCHGVWSVNMIKLLERRLDVCVWRAFWCTSPTHARDMVRRGHIMVNGHVCTQSSYSMQPGDVISVCPQQRTHYQQHLVDTWSTTSVHQAHTMSNTSLQRTSTSLSSVDIITHSLVYGTCTPVHTSSHGYVVCCNAHHGTSQQTSRFGDIANTAQICLDAILQDSDISQHVWAHVCSTQHITTPQAYAMPHIEVDYTTMSMIYLYTPQRVVWTALVDMDVLYDYFVS